MSGLRYERYDVPMYRYEVWNGDAFLGIAYQLPLPARSAPPWVTSRTGNQTFPTRKAAAAALVDLIGATP